MQLIEQALTDARYALRACRREPALVVGIVVTFALAIGANAAMFGLFCASCCNPRRRAQRRKCRAYWARDNSGGWSAVPNDDEMPAGNPVTVLSNAF